MYCARPWHPVVECVRRYSVLRRRTSGSAHRTDNRAEMGKNHSSRHTGSVQRTDNRAEKNKKSYEWNHVYNTHKERIRHARAPRAWSCVRCALNAYISPTKGARRTGSAQRTGERCSANQTCTPGIVISTSQLEQLCFFQTRINKHSILFINTRFKKFIIFTNF